MGRYIGAGWIGCDEVKRALQEAVKDWDDHRKTLDTLERALQDGEHNPASVEQLPGVRYAARAGGMYWLRKRDEAVRLSNFTAYITEDLKLDDGSGETRREYVIENSIGRARVPVKVYPTMRWVAEEWGTLAKITVGHNHEKHLAAAIVDLSEDVKLRTIYTHLGWRKIGGRWCYLHAGGAIGAEGVEVQVGDTLAQFVLPQVTDVRAAVLASLDILTLAPPQIIYPLWGAIYRAPLGEWVPMTTSVWLAGRSGVRKTAMALLAQAHFAPSVDARSAANWSSTANANERIAFLAKDTLMLFDDFAPHGTPQDVQRLHGAAERLIRGAANRAGRARMNSDATLRAAMYPRCGVLGTGEDIPRGHSMRARVLVIEIKGGDVDIATLTALQAKTNLLAEAMSGYLSWLAAQDQGAFAKRQKELRALASGTHTRTPENIAVIQLGVETALRFAVEVAALSAPEAEAHKRQSWEALKALAAAQDHLLNSENPAQRFLDLIGSVLSSGQGHVASTEGGHPQHASAFGWCVGAYDEDGPIWRAQGRRIGWVKDENLYLEPEATFSEVQKLAAAQHATIALSQTALWRRLDEAGKIAIRGEDDHIATKVRTVDGRKRAICLRVADVVELPETKSAASQPKFDGLPF